MEQKEKMEELTIKFAKGLAEPFTSKDGKELMRIKIPNIDPNDHSPWMSFVLPAKAVHENQYGKGLWAKIPAEGSTTVSQSVKRGEEDGKAIWDRVDTVLSNKQLKGLVEAYKGKEERGADTASQKRSVLYDLKEKKRKSQLWAGPKRMRRRFLSGNPDRGARDLSCPLRKIFRKKLKKHLQCP